MGSTLPIPSGPAYKVQFRGVAQRRHYPPHFLQPTSRSRTIFFKTYVLRDRLDDPPARLDNFSADSRQLRLFTWNVETFIGVEKYSRESTASKKPNLHTQMFLNCHTCIYISPEPLMILMLEWVSLSPPLPSAIEDDLLPSTNCLL